MTEQVSVKVKEDSIDQRKGRPKEGRVGEGKGEPELGGARDTPVGVAALAGKVVEGTVSVSDETTEHKVAGDDCAGASLAGQTVDDGHVLRIRTQPLVDMVHYLEHQPQRRWVVVREPTPVHHLHTPTVSIGPEDGMESREGEKDRPCH